MTTTATAEEVLDFWFGGSAHDAAQAAARKRLWFEASAEFDDVVRRRFRDTVEAAAAGRLEGWLAGPHSALALVLLLDQFPRNIWRGTAQAFSCDAQALRVARHALGAGYRSALSPVEQAFLIMPYQHSESIGEQRESVALYEELLRAASPEWHPLLEENLSFARQHLAIIERFGRFPHRNRILGRISTPEEEQYLASGGATFGQG
ncbi:MAG TPA: DUF924 family protein [Candidatus Eisenbacteria bacterium]|nr:DUF924 family protein [Candidatus Eisenbacteria bacterium]